MRSRLRVLAVLFALLAFSAYFAEGVWASMCAPEMEMARVHASVEHDMNCCPTGMNDDPADSSEPSEQSRSPACPLGTSGSCVAASLLLATTTQVAPSLPEGAVLPLSPDAARDLLLVAAIFHPPKA